MALRNIMGQPASVRGFLVVAGAIGLVFLAAWTWPVPPTPRSLPGWTNYDRFCVACHGERGDGLGPAAPYTWSRPRNFVAGEYKWRSTAVGEAPLDEDLRTAIRYGAPGTSMHAFGVLTPAQVDELVDVVKAFAPPSKPAPRIALSAPPAVATENGAELWKRFGCVACHGESGRGDGPSAVAPYDLTRLPIRRPRATDDVRGAIAMSIATGISPMPGYAGTLSDAQIWALADHVLALNASAKPRDRSALDRAAIDFDRTAKIMAGTWPGTGPDAVVFGTPVPPQGAPPPSLAPAQASLSAKQCARCHAKQFGEWTGSIHSLAVGPGLLGQIDHALPEKEASSCRRCHAPLAEQATDHALRAEGIQCAGCHVRQWTRHGPPNISPTLLPLPGYPAIQLELYERGDLCMTCHQLPPRTAVDGKPLLNTYKEWLEGPYMKRGVQCQHCHMPNREHTFKGVHDRDTFRQGFELFSSTVRNADTVTVVAEIVNVGAGHYLPTTPTPSVHVTIELLDASGALIPGATSTYEIKRDIYFDGTWHERGDTRIPPGETRTVARAWIAKRATHARITVAVHPDAFYELIYAQRLRGTLVPAQVALYKQALATAISRRYVAETRTITIR